MPPQLATAVPSLSRRNPGAPSTAGSLHGSANGCSGATPARAIFCRRSNSWERPRPSSRILATRNGALGAVAMQSAASRGFRRGGRAPSRAQVPGALNSGASLRWLRGASVGPSSCEGGFLHCLNCGHSWKDTPGFCGTNGLCKPVGPGHQVQLLAKPHYEPNITALV